MNRHHCFISLLVFCFIQFYGQNLVVDGTISNKVNWNNQEAPFNAGTFESTYLVGACNTNQVMEADNGSSPQQVVNGFIAAKQYVLTFRCAYRNNGGGSSTNPSTVQFQFTDAVGVLTYAIAIPNTQNVLTTTSFTFTNDASTSHTLRITNPGNVNTTGIIIDDISINLLSAPAANTTNLALWLNASSINQADATNINGWISQGLNALPFTPPCATRPVYKTGLASAANNLVANYNPYLTFDGATQYLQYITSRVNLYDNSPAGEGDTYFAVYQGGGNNLTYFGHRGVNDSRTWGKTNNYVFPNGAGAGTNNEATYAQGTRVNLVTMAGKSNGLTLSDLKGTTIANTNNSADADFLTVGVRRNGAGTYSEFYNNSLSELIIFNTILNNTDIQKVRAYLASKYGVTLTDNTTTAGIDERDYIATNATNYWSFASNSAYHNNVTVIGRDDATQLKQVKSISTDADAGSNTGNGMLIVDNVAVISSDFSFFATGHNGISIPTGGADFIDVPATIQSRFKRIWKFQKTGAGIAASINVSFDMTGVSPLTGSDLRLLVSNTPSFAGASIIAGAYVAPYFTAALPTTGGVYYTVASTNSVTTTLPIELLTFSATPNENKVNLNWSTATEINNDYFNVLRSPDAVSFTEIGKVVGSGNSTSRKDYSFVDTNPLNGTSYYRLKQTDFSGAIKYFNIVSVNIEKANGKTLFSLFPNPNTGDFTVDFSGIENNHEVKIVLRDQKGVDVYNNVFYSESVEHNLIQMHLKDKLAAGLYYCTLSAEGIDYTVKVIVN